MSSSLWARLRVAGIAAICVSSPIRAAELPQPCVLGSCGPGVSGFVTSGVANATTQGNSVTVDQSSATAILNWSSFNISNDGTVTFRQPDSSAIALNRIYQGSPSRIFGALNANGRVFLINQNGIVFGEGAQVNVGGLVASSLNITPESLERGIALAAQANAPAFVQFTDSNGQPLPSGPVAVERGAVIRAPGGQVLMFAPDVVRNDGSIRTPDGQTLLAAGRSVFLTSSSDPNLRGLLVEVSEGGSVFNGSAASAVSNVAEIVAERGNVTLAGLAVNQNGRVTATTSVRANGSIRLQARDTASATTIGNETTLLAVRGGALRLGAGSETKVLLDRSAETTVDVNPQPRSRIELDGRDVQILDRAQVVATSGTIAATARVNTSVPILDSPDADESRLYIAPGATLDVSGARIDLPVERNVLRVELRGNQLADSPLQRTGPLRGQTVFVDIRRSGVRADGTRWQGTPLADLTGDIGTIQRTVEERSLTGGSIALVSQGSVLVDRDATINLSGGHVRYLDGYLNTTQLLSDGALIDIGDADRDRRYQGIASFGAVENPRWGINQIFAGPGRDARGVFEAGYLQGFDAGTLNLAAPRGVFDGAVIGEVTRGRYQRNAAQSVPAGQLYRAFDQAALPARLVIGLETASASQNSLVRSVVFADAFQMPTLRSLLGGSFDPRSDPVPDAASRIVLRPSLFGPGRVGSLTVAANEEIRLATGIDLTLPAGGQISLQGRNVRVGGSISGAGSSVTLRSQPTLNRPAADAPIATTIDATARIDVSGRFVNDNPLLTNGDANDALFTSAGSINLQSREGSVTVARGSEFDLRGSLWRRADGRITPGRGGNFSASVTPRLGDGGFLNPVSLQLDGAILAESFGAGGTLTITANAICVAPRNCAADSSTLWLTPEALVAPGFADIRLSSNLGGISVLPETTISLVQRNRLLVGDISRVVSGSDLGALSRTVVLPGEQRAATNLSLSVVAPAGGVPVDRTRFADLGQLTIGRNAVVAADPLARIALQSNTQLLVDGRLSAPGGRVTLDLAADLNVDGFFANQGIWLGDNAVLDVAGFARILTDDRNQRSGRVFDGGSVTLRAARGSIVLQPGSSIDVSGTQATLDQQIVDNGLPRAASTQIASNGGSIELTAAESILAAGSLNARSGNERLAFGGDLRVTLTAADRQVPVPTLGATFPNDPRRIVVRDSLAPSALGLLRDIPNNLAGTAVLSAAQVRAGGFSSLNLSARNVLSSSQEVLSFGEVAFEGNVALNLGRRLILDAPVVSTNGGNAALRAPYIAISSTDAQSQSVPQVAAASAGLFTAEASLIDLIGNSVISGSRSIQLTSTGDIRARGVQFGDAPVLDGSFAVSGDLTLRAQQIYPATYSQFTVRAAAREDARISVEATSGTRSTLLSAGGRIALEAPTIEQGGVLRAPFGSVALRGESIVLRPGSITSTSGDGLTIPFGNVQGGFDWVYELPNGRIAVFDGSRQFLPAQRIDIDAERVALQAGATVDVSGGGDLLAYEFVPGVGGTRDLLAPASRPNQFAILPTIALPFAPFDAREYVGSTLLPGDSVYLAGVPGVPAGFYALLPARYALLPGAYLVTAMSGFEGIRAGETFAQPDGSTVVAGYRTFLDSGFGASRLGGFAVRPGGAILTEAQYQLSSANQFFSRPQIAETAAANTRRPADAGLLAINAGRSLSLDATLRATTAGGRGAAVDLSADSLRIIADGAAAPARDTVLVTASSLNRLGAESVLVGGTRRTLPNGLQLTTTARSIVVDDGARLEAPELTLIASDSLRIAAQAQVLASGMAPLNGAEVLTLSGDGALVRVTTGAQASVVRDASVGLTGALELESGSRLGARGGALLLDASGTFRADGALDAAGASLALAANAINIGSVPRTLPGLTLRPDQFTNLDARELVFTSRSPIRLFGDVDLNATFLSLDTPGIVGVGAGSALFRADRVRIANSAAAQDVAESGARYGSLRFQANEIQLGDGVIAVRDVGELWLESTADLRFVGSGGIEARAPTSVVARRVTGNSGVTGRITSADTLTISAPSASTGLAPALDSLGARIELQGARVRIASQVLAPAGLINVRAFGPERTDGITLTAGTVLDASSRSVTFDGQRVFAPAGALSLAANAGDVTLTSGVRLDVSATSDGGDAGSVSIFAPRGEARLAGELRGSARAGFRGGTFALDADQFGTLDSWSAALNTGGFFASREFRQRGAGDLLIGGDMTNAVRASEVSLTADRGGIQVTGTVDASGARAGRVSLAARDAIEVTGRILARAGADGAPGGRIEMLSSTGAVRVQTGSVLDATGGAAGRGGSVWVRAPRAVVSTLADADPANDLLRLNGSILGAAEIAIEGYRAYDITNGSIGAAQVLAAPANPIFADAQAFAAQYAAIRAGLPGDFGTTVRLLAGLELRSPDALTLSTDWNLYPWQFGGNPGVLTLRAGGDLQITRSLSDGFVAPTSFALPPEVRDSWSYRLIAGADFSSARPTSAVATVVSALEGGDIRVGAGARIRTGNGNIELSAARDLSLATQTSTIYTAGVDGVAGVRLAGPVGLARLPYPVDGGDIAIRVGRDIQGARSNQLVTDWLWRTGRPASGANPIATAWTPNYQRFEQNIGALAGGNIDIRAGGSIFDLSANIASIGRQVGGSTPQENRVEVIGGGDLTVRASGDVLGGSYYVGLGSGELRASGRIGSSDAPVGGLQDVVLALGDAQLSVRARQDARIGTIINPTLLPQGSSQARSPSTASYFSTYGAGASADVASIAGNVTFVNDTTGLVNRFTSIPRATANAFIFYPPALQATAFTSDIAVLGSATLYPSSRGNLEFFAERDIRLGADGAAFLLMSDADPDVLPSIARPGNALGEQLLKEVLDSGFDTLVPEFNALIPLHSSQRPGAAGGRPARLVARTGDISIDTQLVTAGFYFPKPARVVAGRDVRNLTLIAQNLHPSDVTSVVAGRDLIYVSPRTDRGLLGVNDREIALDGPGFLDVRAGRSIDLQTSGGISTRGNINNSSLPASGANVTVSTGVGGQRPALEAFLQRYVVDASSYDAALLSFVRVMTGREPANKTQALSVLSALPESLRQQFAQQVLFAEIRTSGRAAASTGSGDFRAAFAALETLFPGSNPESGTANTYRGDLSLFFSRIYTLDGGNISLLAPGGRINAGLASPPSAFGINKPPSRLGIVAQTSGSISSLSFGDFQVNESRVFAADGGNILVWSTRGDIDAGRGAKTAISAPPPTITFDNNGRLVVTFPAALTGSGIQTLATSPGVRAGDVDLFAPRGVVNAGDAGIVAGNLTIAATAVLGAGNIQVSGTTVGVPLSTSGLAAGLAGVSNVSSSASAAATTATEGTTRREPSPSPLADQALGFLDVFLEGFGAEVCKPTDIECLKRSQRR